MAVQTVEQDAVVLSAASNTTIAEIIIPRQASILNFEVENTHGAVAFDTFIISQRPTENANYEILADSAANYSSAQIPILRVSDSTPVTLAAGASTHILVDVWGIDAIKIEASGNAAASEATLRYSIRSQPPSF